LRTYEGEGVDALLAALREREASIAALEARRSSLRAAVADIGKASKQARMQLELLAASVPEIAGRARPARRLELLIEMTTQPPESPHSVSRERSALRERVWRTRSEDYTDIERACSTHNEPL
jgi:hypothetical protein